MKVFDAMKDKTRKVVQMAKEKVGLSQSTIDPEYESAVEKYHVLRDRVKQFIEDFRTLVTLIPSISQSGVEYSQAVMDYSQNEKSECEIGYALQQFHATVASLIEQQLIPSCESCVMVEVMGMKKKFKHLGKLKEDRTAAALLANACRDDLARASEFKPDEITSLRIKYEGYLIDLEKKTKDFENEVNKFWELRFTILDLPMQRFIGLIFDLCKKTFEEMKKLQTKISHDALVADYQPNQDVKLTN